jgi:endogenous inhibitor of DNA gyrase (YacG/DUF329 family)
VTERPDDRALWAVAGPATGCGVDQPCAECTAEGAWPRHMWPGQAAVGPYAPDQTTVAYDAPCPACGKMTTWAGSPVRPVEILCDCQAVEAAA